MTKHPGLYPHPKSKFIYMGYMLDGKYRRESTKCTNMKDAEKVREAKLTEIKAAHNGLIPLLPTRDIKSVTVATLLADYIADCELRGCKSIRQIKVNVAKVIDAIGSVKVESHLTDELIARYTREMVNAGVAASTINHRLQSLKQAIAPFFRKKLRREMPEIKRLFENNVRETLYTDEQAEAIIANLPEHLQDFVRWAYYTGWRLGEIQSLLWANVDRQARELRLSYKSSKSGKERVIGLDDDLFAIIERRWAARAIEKNGITYTSPYVFHWGVKDNGDVRPIGDIRKTLRKAIEAAGLPYGRKSGYTFHCNRRSALTNMRRAGTPEGVAMMISGHQTRSVFERYNIVSADDTRAAMAAQAARRASRKQSNVVPLKKVAKG